jgi:hypothetical protein
MSSGLIIALELTLVLGVVLGLAVWELLSLRRDRARDADQAQAPRRRGAGSPTQGAQDSPAASGATTSEDEVHRSGT